MVDIIHHHGWPAKRVEPIYFFGAAINIFKDYKMDRNEHADFSVHDIAASKDTDKELGNEALTQKLIGWFQEDIAHCAAWRVHAREDYAFYNGEQWAAEDMAVLREQRRPVMTFNRVAPLVNAVIGSEINNRRQVRYIPREIGDSIANELLTGAGEWFRDQSGAEDEDSDAFADTVICGMGWTDTRLDFENNPDGDPLVQRLDPLKMVWDCGAVKANLGDARRLWYVDEKPLEDVKAMFPNIDSELLHADWAKTLAHDPQGAHIHQAGSAYNDNNDYGFSKDDRGRKMCTLVECRYVERENFYRGPDLLTGNPREYSQLELNEILKRFKDFPFIKQSRKVVKRAFLGRTLLAPPDSPLAPKGMFGWECITGYYDRMKRQFYGVVRPAKDPQRWSNKFFSQVMYLLNSQAKGGIMAERGAFEDDRQAEDSLARADQVTWMRNGALSGNAARIQPKPVAQFPSGFFTLFNESKEALTQVTGLSPEFIGTREVNQPGVLEAQRRQSSLNLLASLFNSLRRYRKRQGTIVLYLLQNYLSDGRLVRIIGEDKSQYVPLTRDTIANRSYDIIVDDAPTSPNEKERTFAIIQQMLPILRDYITPEIGMEILRYSPLPASLIDRWQRLSAAQKEAMPEQNTASSEADIKLQGLQADIAGKTAKQRLEVEAKSIDLYMKQLEAEAKARDLALKAASDAQSLAVAQERNAIARQRVNNQRANS